MARIIDALALNVRSLREAKGLSQVGLAKEARLARGVVSKIEGGRGGLTQETIAKLAKALGVEETDLVASELKPQSLLGAAKMVADVLSRVSSGDISEAGLARLLREPDRK